jgi:2-polyprenyl-3-methyl-5-hydroxy-6-metoxy-1,4-benzoquinol methylase
MVVVQAKVAAAERPSFNSAGTWPVGSNVLGRGSSGFPPAPCACHFVATLMPTTEDHPEQSGARETPPSPEHAIRASWDDNAAVWARVVRGGLIPSRRLVTDDAILNACRTALDGKARPRVLDLGCGEGWLAYSIAAFGAEVVGIDGSAELITLAGSRIDEGAPELTRDQRPNPSFLVLSYDQLVHDDASVRGPFDLIVCNYALLGETLSPLLAALRSRLDPSGVVVIQTVHPATTVGDAPYTNGWRVETFANFEQPFPSSMPWYFRTLGSWVETLARAGLYLLRLDEPLHPETQRPISLVLTATA